jgi:hypothetical protein
MERKTQQRPQKGPPWLAWVARMGRVPIPVWIIAAATLVFVDQTYEADLWDWLDLLIVPAVLAGGGLWFNWAQQTHQDAIEQERRDRELDVAKQSAQDDALQAYLDHIGNLLLDEKVREALTDLKEVHGEPNQVRALARARTFTVLERVDGERKGNIIRFLHEAHLIRRIQDEHRPIIDLYGANLERANLSGSFLQRIILKGADLSEANLSEANLTNADLSDAKGLTEEQLAAAKTLEGATMPDGSVHD